MKQSVCGGGPSAGKRWESASNSDMAFPGARSFLPTNSHNSGEHGDSRRGMCQNWQGSLQQVISAKQVGTISIQRDVPFLV